MRHDSGLRPQGRTIPLGYLVMSREPDPSTVVEFDTKSEEHPIFISKAQERSWRERKNKDCIYESAKALFPTFNNVRSMPLPPPRTDVIDMIKGSRWEDLVSVSLTDRMAAERHIRKQEEAEDVKNYMKRLRD